MVYIKVDFNHVNNKAKEIDAFISKQNKAMKKIDSYVIEINDYYKGMDYTAIVMEWKEMYNGSSNNTHKSMKNALSSYAELLRYSMKVYKDAQKKACSRGRKL